MNVRINRRTAALLPRRITADVTRRAILVPLLRNSGCGRTFLSNAAHLITILDKRRSPNPPIFSRGFSGLDRDAFTSTRSARRGHNGGTILLVILLILTAIVPVTACC